MTPPESTHDNNALGSFLRAFEFSTEPIPESARYLSISTAPPKQAGASSLNTKHPAYGVMGKQIDAAAAMVRKVEEYLNRQGTFCVPVYSDIGVLQYYPGDYMEWHGTPGGSSRELDWNTQYGLAIVRANDKWRVAIYRWTIFGIERESRKSQSKPSRKPWLEASFMDKAVTLSHLPKLFDKLFKQVALMVRVATLNEEGLKALGDFVKSIPGT